VAVLFDEQTARSDYWKVKFPVYRLVQVNRMRKPFGVCRSNRRRDSEGDGRGANPRVTQSRIGRRLVQLLRKIRTELFGQLFRRATALVILKHEEIGDCYCYS
jgi:hypothetical protein